MRLLLCGGGTAGHINPAIAIAEEMKKSHPDAQILFVGREGGKENDHVLKSGFKQKTLRVYGLKRSFSLDNLSRVKSAIKAKGEAEKIIKEFKPDVILGTGGYVCWPVISAGRKLHIPTAIHESNVYPGLTTRLLAKKCDKILLNREETKKYLNSKVNTVTVGNPIRADFGRISPRAARARMGVTEEEILIVSFGGSIGAERLNEVIIEVMKEHSSKVPNIKHVHATGRAYFDRAKGELESLKFGGCKIVPYIDDMPSALLAADIVICRCGAITLSEISAAGVAAILVPSPNVTANHQYKNALLLSEHSAADVIEEKNLSKESLLNLLKQLEIDKNGRKTRAKNIKVFFTPNAAKDIVKELFLLKK